MKPSSLPKYPALDLLFAQKRGWISIITVFLIIILVFPHYYYDFFTFIIPGTTGNGIISVSSVIPVSSVFSSLKFTLSTSS